MSDDLGVTSDGSESSAAPASPAGTPSSADVGAAPALQEPSALGDSGSPATPHESHVPYQRFREVNEGYQRLKQSYGWLQEDALPHVRQFVESYRQNPAETILGELKELAQNPAYQQLVRSHAARILGMRGQQPEADPLQPLQLATQDGQPLDLYTADQVKSLIDNALNERLSPLQQDYQQRQTTQQVQAARLEAIQQAKAQLGEFDKMPHFKEQRDAIKHLFKTKYTTEAGYSGREGVMAAYLEVLTGKVLPGLANAERNTVLSSLQQKAGASTVNPGRPAHGMPAESPTSFRAALEAQLGAG